MFPDCGPRPSAKSTETMKIPKSHTCYLEHFWCDSTIKLPSPVETPLGGRVTLIRVCVDVEFSLEREIIVHHVKLCEPEGGGLDRCNVASARIGEAWRASRRICSESQLRAVVDDELADRRGRLRNLMLKVWRIQHREVFAQTLVNCLNGGTSPESIEELIKAFGGGIPVVFSYIKEDGIPERHRVFVNGTSGRCLRGIDQKDEKRKSFRLDRISKAETEVSSTDGDRGSNLHVPMTPVSSKWGCLVPFLVASLVIIGFILAIFVFLYAVR